ncbi:KEOPS complex subunit Cgi121 [uncultured Methanobrevibacter sp.]|uniref:KEOPS complex subunit Cgi121 n=1 Tax=uncultured Methanobrevibacter sp. TaxID=253161 RepID=UPI0025CBC0AA|nr:KEOPS complex subunit Cgi121 [uncultured Methanobrevibacter sp.]
MDNLTENIQILGYKGQINNIPDILEEVNNLKDQCCDGCVIQLLDARAVGGRKHVLHGTIQAIQAFNRGTNLANDLGIEICIRISAQRQISKALKLLGLYEGEMDICIVMIDCPDYFIDQLNDMFDKDNSIFEADIPYLKSIYKISDKELESIHMEDLLIDKTTSLIVDV